MPAVHDHAPESDSPVNDVLVRELVAAFRAAYASEPRVFFAPGRVNLIGAHLDYNGGSVLPAPVARGTYVAVAPSSGDRSRFASMDLELRVDVGLTETPDADQLGWAAYAYGVLDEGRKRALRAGAVDVFVAGDLPRGAGLSSSASLEVATGLALETWFGWDLEPVQLAELAWTVENGFVGVKCGIMDQFASALARPAHALHLDCASRQWRHVPLAGVELTVIDSCKQRELVVSEFNARVEQCSRAYAVLDRHWPGRANLAEFTTDEVESLRDELEGVLYRRARHVATEVVRIREAVAALEGGDIAGLGLRMREAHESCRVDYEVSCDELDFLVDTICAVDGVHGARLTGAGFGGCVVAVHEPDAFGVREFARLASAYEQRFGLEPLRHELHVGGGPREIAWQT